MPANLQRKKTIVQIAETVVPQIIKSAQTQDLVLSNVNALPEQVINSRAMTDKDLLISLNQDFIKAIKDEDQYKRNHEKKSFLFDPFGFVDTATHRQQITGLSYKTMSEMARQCKPVAAIINTRINQVASFTRSPRDRFSLGYKFVKKSGKPTDADQNTISKLEQYIQVCGEDSKKRRDPFDQYVRKVARDRLTYDQWNTERVFTHGNSLHEFIAVDASTIRIAVRKFLNEDSSPYTNRTSSDDVGVTSFAGRDFNTVNVPIDEKAYVQIINGQTVTEYTEEEMMFLVANPRTDIIVAGYGYSEVEQLVETITSILFAAEYNRRFFSAGASPKGMINVKGNISQPQLDSFKRQWFSQLTGTTGQWRTPIVNANDGIEWVNMQQTNREMEFGRYQEFLVRIACAVFQIAPEEINFSSTSSSSGQMTFESRQEQRLKASRDKGLVPLLTFFENGINREIVSRLTDKFEFRFVGLDGMTEVEKLQMDIQRINSYQTINEIRFDNDLDPVVGGDVINNPSFMQVWNFESQQKQQQAQFVQQQEQAAQQQEDMVLQQGMMNSVDGNGNGQPQEAPSEQEQLTKAIRDGIDSGDFVNALDNLKGKPVTIELNV